MKTRNLIGPALDWAVAKCEGVENTWGKSSFTPYDYFMGHRCSTDWSQGGPIIERESIAVTPCEDMESWASAVVFRQGVETQYGPTPLIAAMRSYVASKLGDEVDIPEELL